MGTTLTSRARSGGGVPQELSRGRTRRARSVLALTVAAALGFTISPAVAAEPGLADPVLDLRFEGNTTDASTLANPVALKGHNGSSTLNYAYVPGVSAGKQALQLNGNTYLDLGKRTELQPHNLTL